MKGKESVIGIIVSLAPPPLLPSDCVRFTGGMSGGVVSVALGCGVVTQPCVLL
jgi:hypothetical protein